MGAIFVINVKVVGMDCFGRPDIHEKTFMQMLEGYAQDAADKFDPEIDSKSSKAEAMDFLQITKKSRVHIKQSAWLASRCTLKSGKCAG